VDTEEKPLTLRDLIIQHQDRTGDSYSMLAARCDLSKAKIGQLATAKKNHMPRAYTLEQLAKGMNLPLKTVQQAAMASAGITPEGFPGGNRIDLVVASLRELAPDDLETAAIVIQSLKDRRTLRPAS
jgi:hypothetical protein